MPETVKELWREWGEDMKGSELTAYEAELLDEALEQWRQDLMAEAEQEHVGCNCARCGGGD